MLQPVSWRNWNWIVLWRHTRPSRTRTQKTWDWNAKWGSQEISRVTGKFGLGVQNEAGQRLTEFCKEKHTGHSKHPLPTTQEKTLHMDISPDVQYQNKLIMYFAAKSGEALYSHQKRNALVIANTLFQQYTRRLHMDITIWSIPKSDDYILCSQRWRSSIKSSKARWGAHCGSDHELLIAKFRLKLKKVVKTTRPFRSGLKSNPLYSGSDK